MKQEEFQISKEILEEFIKGNSKNLNKGFKNRLINGKKCIVISCSMVRMQISWIIPKIIYAKGMEEVTGAIPVFFYMA